jgi:hypothetical protein
MVVRYGGNLLRDLMLISVPLRFAAGWLFWTDGDAWKTTALWEISMGFVNGFFAVLSDR